MKVLSCYCGVRLQVFQVPTYMVPILAACLLLSKTNIVGTPAVPYLFFVSILFRGFKIYGYNLGIRSCWIFFIFVFQGKICVLTKGLVFRAILGSLESISLTEKEDYVTFP